MITISEAVPLAAALAAGLLLGLLYFGGLKSTVQRLPGAVRPTRLFILSLVIRLVAMAVAFFVVAQFGRWDLLLSCLLGVLVGRWAVVRHRWPDRGRCVTATRGSGR